MAKRNDLGNAVERIHGCAARYREDVHVCETFEGAVVWEGDVAVFDLEGCGGADLAYAWSARGTGGKERFYAILHAGPIQSAADAVRAAIAEEYHRREGEDQV